MNQKSTTGSHDLPKEKAERIQRLLEDIIWDTARYSINDRNELVVNIKEIEQSMDQARQGIIERGACSDKNNEQINRQYKIQQEGTEALLEFGKEILACAKEITDENGNFSVKECAKKMMVARVAQSLQNNQKEQATETAKQVKALKLK